MNKILVTGEAGLLGSQLCARLFVGGSDVLCVDNDFTGSKSNVAGRFSKSNFELGRHDVTSFMHVDAHRIFEIETRAKSGRTVTNDYVRVGQASVPFAGGEALPPWLIYGDNESHELSAARKACWRDIVPFTVLPAPTF